MTVASCPSCRESVTVPIDASSESIVRCPLCHEEFRMAEFLAQLPPPLIVISRGAAGAMDAESDEPSALEHGGNTPATDAEVEHEDVPAFDFTPGSVAETRDVRLEGTARPRSVGKHPAWEIATIIAGALLAVPTAQLILWWLPGTWKRDLLGIGPAVSRVAPWIVPEQFEGTRERGARPDRVTAAGQAPVDASEVRKLVSGENDPDDQGRWAPSANAHLPAADALKEYPTDLDLPEVEGAAETVVPGTRSPQSRPSVVSAIKDGPLYQLEDLRKAVEEALQASVAWDTSPEQSAEHRQELTDQFYAAFARLGETVTFVLPGDPAVRELAAAIQDLLQTFTRQPKKLAMIGNRSAQWLGQPVRPNRGVLLFGTVRRIQPTGALFTTHLELASRKQATIAVVSHVDPKPFYQTGDRILMLGAIVDNPSENLAGYEGFAARVVMGSFPVPLQP